ncbi:hypothetical protein [Phaeobacter piscinae]|uniref:hypothetical protein n=1 Tax=Phaeobacter piscinae TaxID=1580596 RepID=UPI001314A53F|nr:hypothetical protein [Phaeobacter piscinae]
MALTPATRTHPRFSPEGRGGDKRGVAKLQLVSIQPKNGRFARLRVKAVFLLEGRKFKM